RFVLARRRCPEGGERLVEQVAVGGRGPLRAEVRLPDGVECLRGLLPPLRNLGERDEPHAGVLAALVVVGGRGEEGARVAVRAEAGPRVERLRVERPAVRLAADLRSEERRVGTERSCMSTLDQQ